MTHSESNNILWSSGRIPYAVAIGNELRQLGIDDIVIIKLLRDCDGYIRSAMERGRQPSSVAQDLFKSEKQI